MAERDLSLLADDAFRPPYLRSATIHGASPRLRPDIVMNNLTAVAKTTGTCPDLSMRWTVSEGADGPSGAWTGYGLTYDDFMSSRFVRRRQIPDVPDDFVVAWPTR